MEVDIALGLDHDLAEAHATLGLILMDDYDFKGAEREFKRAIELKPSYATAHHWYFRVLRTESRWDEALQQIEKAVELDPFSQIINLNQAEYYESIRDYAKAIELAKKTIELDPNFGLAHFQLATIYAKMKRFEDARREAKIGTDLVKEAFPNMRERFEAFLAFSGDDKEGVRRLLPIVETSFQDPMGAKAAEIGGYHIYLGDVDNGFEWLEKSYSKKESALLDITSDPTFDGVRNDPRYQNLLKRLGLEQRSPIPAT